MALLRKELQDPLFYEHSLSLFMKDSPGILDRCKMYVNILQNILNCGENIFKILDIFYYKKDSSGALKTYFTENNINPEEYTDKWLDQIASILGISRKFTVPRYYSSGAVTEAPFICELTNKELLIYIEATIAKYNFDGTCQSLRKIYKGTPIYNLNVYSNRTFPAEIINYLDNMTQNSFLTELGIVYKSGIQSETDFEPAYCMISINSEKAIGNLKTLYINGLLTIESMGITYVYVFDENIKNGYFASVPEGKDGYDIFTKEPFNITTFYKGE